MNKQPSNNPTKDGQTNWDKRERAPWSQEPKQPAPPPRAPTGLRRHELQVTA
jgi:hypothetical protein